MRKSCLLFIILIPLLTLNAQSPAQEKWKLQPIDANHIFQDPGYFHWGGSVLKTPDGLYHLYYSRWKKEYSFYGWLTHSEIAHAISNKPFGPWTYIETALAGRGPGYWDAITAHNPKIKYFDGKYYLYYISTHLNTDDYTEADLIATAQTGYEHPNWKILRPNQRTGVAVADRITGPWTRLDQPMIEPSGPITTLTVNPAIARGQDGQYYLIVKGDKPNESRFIRNQALAIGQHPTGPWQILDQAVIDTLDTEDMSLWYNVEDKRLYGVYHAHTHIGMISSGDGKHWQPEQALSQKMLRFADGTTLEPQRLERPFVYDENGEPIVLCLAAKLEATSWTIFVPLIRE